MNSISPSDLKGKLEKICQNEGVDFFGVASVERFRNAPKYRRPQDILAKTKSIISIGLSIPDGVSEANHRAFAEDHMRHGIYIYQMHGYLLLNQKLNQTAYSLAKNLEKRGYKSTPIPASPPMDTKNLMGVFSNRHAAVAAGLAEFGWNALAITKESGPRVRWTSVLTTAALPADPLSDEGICLYPHCMECVKACPMNAIPEKESVTLQIEDHIYEYAKLNKWRCTIGGDSGLSTSLAERQLEVPAEPEPDDYLTALDLAGRWQKIERMEAKCGRCIIECPVGK